MLKLAAHSRFGLARAAVFKDGQPHLYAEGLELDERLDGLGARSVARIKACAAGMIFLELADGREAILEAPNEVVHRLTEGLAVEIIIVAEARGDKSARARFIATREGEALSRLSAPVSLIDRLKTRAAEIWPGEPLNAFEGDEVEEALSNARHEALSAITDLPGGGTLSIEPTRALIACDVDGGGFAGFGKSAKSYARQCNDAAITEVVRRLRLSNLAGLVVIDLIGNRHDFDHLRGLMAEALGGEGKGVIIGPITRFGTFEFVRPWGAKPLKDQVRDDRALSQAIALMGRAVEAAVNDAGALFTLKGPAEVIALLQPRLEASYGPLSARLKLQVVPGTSIDVVRL